MLLASSAQQEERTSVSQRYALDRATATIEDDVLALSEFKAQNHTASQGNDQPCSGTTAT